MITIRKSNSKDIETLVEILEEARKFKESLGDHVWGVAPFTTDEVKGMSNQGNLFTAYVDDSVAGCVMISWDDSRYWGEITGMDSQAGYIHRLSVGNKFRGQRIGEQIVEWSKQYIRDNDKKYVRLDCPSDNKDLCDYYEKLGFSKIKSVVVDGYEADLYQLNV
jgi:ribosomal protein S18 acetylase RimI-like enzyme